MISSKNVGSQISILQDLFLFNKDNPIKRKHEITLKSRISKAVHKQTEQKGREICSAQGHQLLPEGNGTVTLSHTANDPPRA